MQVSKSNEGMSFFIGLLAGTAIGVSAGLILAPRSGEESRRMLNDRTSEYKSRMSELFAEYRQKAAEAARELQSNTNEALERGKRYCESMRERYAPEAGQPLAQTEVESAPSAAPAPEAPAEAPTPEKA